MTTTVYKRSLRSNRWRQLKWRRIIVAAFKCEDCGLTCTDKRPRAAMRWFHLHHLNYQRVGSERLDDVLVLCPDCHFRPERHPWRIDN